MKPPALTLQEAKEFVRGRLAMFNEEEEELHGGFASLYAFVLALPDTPSPTSKAVETIETPVADAAANRCEHKCEEFWRMYECARGLEKKLAEANRKLAICTRTIEAYAARPQGDV